MAFQRGDSHAKNLRIIKYDGEKVKKGQLIVTQRGTRYKPGKNMGIGKDHTLYSLIDGVVKFQGGRIVNVLPVEAKKEQKPAQAAK